MWKKYHSLAFLHIDLVADDHLVLVSVLQQSRQAKKSLTKGKFSGSIGLACIKNSSRQLSSVSKLLELFTS